MHVNTVMERRALKTSLIHWKRNVTYLQKRPAKIFTKRSKRLEDTDWWNDTMEKKPIEEKTTEEMNTEKKDKVIKLEMPYEEAKSKYLNRNPVRLSELWREDEEKNMMLVIDRESAEVYRFNISAKEIWKMCSGSHSVEAIAQHIYESMENAQYEKVLQDTLRFLMILEKLGLLGWNND